MYSPGMRVCKPAGLRYIQLKRLITYLVCTTDNERMNVQMFGEKALLTFGNVFAVIWTLTDLMQKIYPVIFWTIRPGLAIPITSSLKIRNPLFG